MRGSSKDFGLHVFGGAQAGVAVHKSHAAGIGADIDGSEVGIGGDDLDASQADAQNFSHDLGDHGVAALPDIRGSRINHHAAIAINLDVHGRVRHV